MTKKQIPAKASKKALAKDKNGTLEETVVTLLKKKKLQLSLAESLTGGMIAQRIVNVAGASEVFGYGFVTYSNKAKHKCLGVKKSTRKNRVRFLPNVQNRWQREPARHPELTSAFL